MATITSLINYKKKKEDDSCLSCVLRVTMILVVHFTCETTRINDNDTSTNNNNNGSFDKNTNIRTITTAKHCNRNNNNHTQNHQKINIILQEYRQQGIHQQQAIRYIVAVIAVILASAPNNYPLGKAARAGTKLCCCCCLLLLLLLFLVRNLTWLLACRCHC